METNFWFTPVFGFR